MIKFTWLLALVVVTAAPIFVQEAAAQESSAKKKKSTEVSFDDVLVQGKYHFSDDVVTTVEEDKVLDSLIGIRTDFKDKIENSDNQF